MIGEVPRVRVTVPEAFFMSSAEGFGCVTARTAITYSPMVSVVLAERLKRAYRLRSLSIVTPLDSFVERGTTAPVTSLFIVSSGLPLSPELPLTLTLPELSSSPPQETRKSAKHIKTERIRRENLELRNWELGRELPRLRLHDRALEYIFLFSLCFL